MDRKTCYNCWHHRDGDCALYSCNCASDVFSQADDPSRWMSIEEGKQLEQDWFLRELDKFKRRLVRL